VTDPAVDLPDVVAEVREAFERYEAALRAHDLGAIDAFFWDDPRAVRYGVASAEHGYGSEAIRAQRRRMAPVSPVRLLARTVITAFGQDAATVSTEFAGAEPDRVGRQTQTWVRLPCGWRIAVAHVSVVGVRRGGGAAPEEIS
jgi:ketosteroid isomerase-like protein